MARAQASVVPTISSDFERCDAGGGRQRFGVERALMGDLLAVGGLGDLEVEQIENILAAGDRAARQPAGEDLRQCRQIGPDAVFRLGAAGRNPEAGDHLVEDQHDAVLPGQFTQCRQEFRLDRQPCTWAPIGSMIAPAMSAKSGLFQPFQNMVTGFLRAELRSEDPRVEEWP